MTALFAIYDTMQLLSCDVATVCIGQAASAAAVILAGGTKGKRFALPNARVLIHQPHGGAQGQSTDLELAVKEMVLLRERMTRALAEDTGQTVEQISDRHRPRLHPPGRRRRGLRPGRRDPHQAPGPGGRVRRPLTPTPPSSGSRRPVLGTYSPECALASGG